MLVRYGVPLFLFLLFLNISICFSQPAPDLRSRIAVDGMTGEYSDGEWIIDRFTPFPEPDGDSRWGRDNDIRRLAVTWDEYYLYIAVDCSFVNGSILLCVDCACGGMAGLQSDSIIRRNISFSGLTPNVVVHATRSLRRPEAIYRDCSAPPRVLDEERFEAAVLQGEYPGGGVEAALPWELLGAFPSAGSGVALPAKGYSLHLLAAVTGGDATGAGDTVPDPTSRLSSDSTRVALLDNYVSIPLDRDEDGVLDLDGVPREIAVVAVSEASRSVALPELSLQVERKSFAPDLGESLRFRPLFQSDVSAPVALTAGVYSVSGRLVRVLFRNRPVPSIAAGLPGAWEDWDGRDAEGTIVPGGIYIIAVTAAGGGAGFENTAKTAVAVVR